MTVEEYLEMKSRQETKEVTTKQKNLVYGLEGIKTLFGCSTTTAWRIKNSEWIRPAISQVGRKIVVDADLTAGYIWFINTPMYLGHELYISYVNRRHPSPGQGFHKAYQATLSGNRKGVKALIRNSNYWANDYRTYADTLRNILSDSTIFINGIQYGQYERLVDYTDSTGIIKSAHFRKDGYARITDYQRMITLEDARNTEIIWKRVR